jgi:hypothetical protein
VPVVERIDIDSRLVAGVQPTDEELFPIDFSDGPTSPVHRPELSGNLPIKRYDSVVLLPELVAK